MFKYPISVTIDTNYFDSTKYDFSNQGSLKILKNYVDEGIIKVVLSNIVIRESKSHLAKQIKKVCGIARRLRSDILKESTEHLIGNIGLERLLEIPKDKDYYIEKSEELFDNYLSEINAEILGTDLICLDSIIDDYFEINPPFEDGEKKRKEFPDAFIANQIRERFGNDEDIVIISKDNGFKLACQQTNNHFFFDSLGELFDTINKEKEEAYIDTISAIKELQFDICSLILEYIKDNESFEVIGRSYDSDGIESGVDYDEEYLHSISNVSFSVRSVDELSGSISKVTLSCKAKIVADCYYDDYENATWDHEEKEYIFLETKHIREEHDSRFACRIELNRNEKTFTVFPFTVILDDDSRKDSYEIDSHSSDNYASEFNDMNREYFGFHSLASYESYLEEDLNDSSLSNDIIEQFQLINDLRICFGEISDTYYMLIEKLNDPDSTRIIKLISESLNNSSSSFPIISDINSIEDEDIIRIKEWAHARCENTAEIADEKSLPDVLNYGDVITIKGVDGHELILAIDSININPTEGCEEVITIRLSNHQNDLARGSIKLTVGYLNFDENENASDGLNDSIEYEYYEVLEEMKNFVIEQIKLTKKEERIAEIIESVIND